MNMNRNLVYAICIPFFLSLPLLALTLSGTPRSLGSGYLYLILLPLGIACPLLATGCLLHDRIQERMPRAAAALQHAGELLFAALSGLLCWTRLAPVL